MVVKYFLFSHQYKIQRLRRKIQATKTLKNFRFKLATEKREWTLDFFLAFWPRHWWWWVGGKCILCCEGECSSVRRRQLDIASGKSWGFYLAFSKEVTLLEVNWSSGGSVYKNSGNSLGTRKLGQSSSVAREPGVISVTLSIQPLLSRSAIQHWPRCGQAKLTQTIIQTVSLLHLAVADDLQLYIIP